MLCWQFCKPQDFIANFIEWWNVVIRLVRFSAGNTQHEQKASLPYTAQSRCHTRWSGPDSHTPHRCPGTDPHRTACILQHSPGRTAPRSHGDTCTAPLHTPAPGLRKRWSSALSMLTSRRLRHTHTHWCWSFMVTVTNRARKGCNEVCLYAPLCVIMYPGLPCLGCFCRVGGLDHNVL